MTEAGTVSLALLELSATEVAEAAVAERVTVQVVVPAPVIELGVQATRGDGGRGIDGELRGGAAAEGGGQGRGGGAGDGAGGGGEVGGGGVLRARRRWPGRYTERRRSSTRR